MKLKKYIYKTNIEFYNKFENSHPSKLKQGDYIRLYFLAHNQKRRGGLNFRINQHTVILEKKKLHKNNFCVNVTALYKKEKVIWRYLINAPHLIKVILIKKNKKKFIYPDNFEQNYPEYYNLKEETLEKNIEENLEENRNIYKKDEEKDKEKDEENIEENLEKNKNEEMCERTLEKNKKDKKTCEKSLEEKTFSELLNDVLHKIL